MKTDYNTLLKQIRSTQKKMEDVLKQNKELKQSFRKVETNLLKNIEAQKTKKSLKTK